MSLEAAANPTGVNAFNGVSDTAKAENHFESLYTKGAFNPDGKPDAAQGQAAPEPARAAPVAAVPDTAAAVPTLQAAPEATHEPEAEGPEYVNVEDYLQKAQLDPESFYALPVTVKVDGKGEQVPLKEALAAYQREADYTRKTQALAEQRRAFEAQQTQARTELEGKLNQASTLATLAHQQLLAEYQGVDWNRLRTEDPARWAVANQEFNNRAAAIQGHLTQVQNQQQQIAQVNQQKLQASLVTEREKMFEALPEWRDQTKFQAARTEISSYARNRGFSDAELSGIFDHRFMQVLHDASRFAQLQAQGSQAVKRVRAAPQMANPGARIQRDPATAARDQAKTQFQKNPRDQDAAARYFGTLA